MNRETYVRSLLFLLSSIALFGAGCMTERVHPAAEYPSVPKQSLFLVKKIEHDDHGRPRFTSTLSDRPGKSGEMFTIVHAVNNRPVRSYDIAILDLQKPDMRRPLAVIYEWTGKGFEVGLVISEMLMPNGFSGSGEAALAYLAFKAAPIVIGGVTGFVIGLVSSVPATAAELKHVIVNAREMVIVYTVYEYDERGRIRFMKLYPPQEYPSELVKTEFFYSEGSVDPYKTEVTSVVEKKVRLLRER
jgi:hypothetical protein